MLVSCCQDYTSLYELLKISFPVYAQLGIVGCKDYLLNWAGLRNPFSTNQRFKAENIISQEFTIESAQTDVALLFKPFFDEVWNNGGWPRSFNYGENGAWAPRTKE
jgi:hypothetical protein